METLQTMRLFVKVAESGSLSAAGRAVGLSPASVSRQINALEQSLGVRLINRTSRKLALTDVGQVYFEKSVSILSQVDDLTGRVCQYQLSPRGLLHVHARVAVGKLFIVPALPSFLQRYPDVNIKLWLTEEARDLVENNIDVAVRLGNLDEPLLAVRKLSEGGPRILVATPDYLDARPPIRQPEDLRDHNCLTWQLDGRFEDGHATWRFRKDTLHKELRLSGNIQVNNAEVLKEMAAAGMGICLLPTWCVWQELAAGTFRRILPEFEVTPTTFDYHIYGVFQRALHVPRKIRAFIDHVVQFHRSSSHPWEAFNSETPQLPEAGTIGSPEVDFMATQDA